MTKLDIYVYNAMRKAYTQGWLDGYERSEGNEGENNFDSVLGEDLFCEEYVELSHEASILAAGLDPETGDPETEHDPDPEE